MVKSIIRLEVSLSSKGRGQFYQYSTQSGTMARLRATALVHGVLADPGGSGTDRTSLQVVQRLLLIFVFYDLKYYSDMRAFGSKHNEQHNDN